MNIWVFQRIADEPAPRGWANTYVSTACKGGWNAGRVRLALRLLAFAAIAAMAATPVLAQEPNAARGVTARVQRPNLPPSVAQAQRFLAQRGWTPGHAPNRFAAARRRSLTSAARPAPQARSGSGTWQPLGPIAVTSLNYGSVTGRITALALDPSDSTGGTLYVGTTGGGVWKSQTANSTYLPNIVFTPLADTVAALSGTQDASISIGALTVQPPGGTGVILAGTGDPNDELDSYYGAGILRSTDGGANWSLISTTQDVQDGLSGQNFSFAGEGIAGFAWNTSNPQIVVAAVSQAYEGKLVNAVEPGISYQGLYYSSDAGATWHLSTITDGSGADVQGPGYHYVAGQPDGNAATSVVWNRWRNVFVAAVRNHGYYQSANNGKTWTRLAAQPGSGLSTLFCPNNLYSTGSPACPIFRGTLAVNPQTGDTFAWTVDDYNQDQGLWMDQCGLSGSVCTQNMAFAQQLNTAALETDDIHQGPATIENGDYTLALAAVPSGQETMVLAGDQDLWKCSVTDSVSPGCVWRNTTNSTVGFCAQVAEYQHALAWNPNNPLEVFVGNDGGLWRSLDAIGESGQVCTASDATHFQNLNNSLGSLAEVVSMSQSSSTPYTMATGLGALGTAGVKSSTATVGPWPTILGGEGGPVAIDPTVSSNWYVNNGAGVSIQRCAQAGACTAATSPSGSSWTTAVDNADVSEDGLTMSVPAAFLVDPLDPSQLLVGTCRVWRGPASGGWSGSNTIPILDNPSSTASCHGDALIRSMAAMEIPGGNEVVYVGMYGSTDGGSILPGHVLTATINPSSSSPPAWSDLTLNEVSNDISHAMNAYGWDISSIYIDPHDTSGQTVYVTLEGIAEQSQEVQAVYRSTDGGKHWANLTANQPWNLSPANSVVVDPQDANTVYLATDAGVYVTQQIATCANQSSACWSVFGTGLPGAPAIQLSATPATSSMHLLIAATYGRGVWETPLLTAGEDLTTATVVPATLSFSTQVNGTQSNAKSVTLTNTGNAALTPGVIATSGDFNETDDCQNATVIPGASCTVQVTFTPSQSGSRSGQLIIGANVLDGQLTVALDGTGTSENVAVSLAPATVSFGNVPVGTASASINVTAQNSGGTAVSFTSAITGPFSIAGNGCGTSIAANSACELIVKFTPTQAGAAIGTLTITDSAGTQSVALNGTGAAQATDALSPTSLTFPGTVDGQLSAAQTVTLTNSGDLNLTAIAASITGSFNILKNYCGTQLGGNANCGISIVFAPTKVGVQSGTLSISDAQRTQTVVLSGTGLEPPAIGVSPSSLTFAVQPKGTASTPQTLTVSNTGGAPMTNLHFQITGDSAGSFSTGTITCGMNLSNGSSCTVQVIFTPAVAGGNTAELVISALGVQQVNVPLSGSGTATTGLSVSPAQLNFPVVISGQSSTVQTVTITDLGAVAANSLTLAISPPFSLAQNTCGSSLAAGASCSAGVIVTPVATGTITGALTVSSASLTTPARVALSGTGGSPAGVQVTPASINFANTGVGQTSSSTVVTITNIGTAASLSNLVLSISSGFQLVNNTCPSTLAASASCTAGVEFAPASAGQQSGVLIIASNSLTESKTVPLGGTGFDFTIAASGSTSQSIASGQTASYQLTVSLLNQTVGSTINLQCGSASYPVPTNATCTFNPSASITVGASSSSSVAVIISTGKAQSSVRTRGAAGWRMLPLVSGLLLLPLGWRRRRRALWLVALLVLMAGAVTSCTSSGIISGSGGPTTGAGNTAAGTYWISVTASSNNVQHALVDSTGKPLITLTVD